MQDYTYNKAQGPQGHQKGPSQARPQGQPEQAAAPKRKTRQPLTYHIWRFADPQMIDELADKYLRGMHAGTARAYLIGLVFLTLITGGLTWYLDIGPTYNFADFALRNSAEFMRDIAPYAQFLPAIIFILALTPALLEFFSVGMALQGNLVMDIAIKIAIVFDAITDLPGARAWAQIITSYFIPLDTPLGGLMSFGATLVIEFFATIAIETLFLSFLLALIRVIKQAVIQPTYVRA